jgi:hypothetical protein
MPKSDQDKAFVIASALVYFLTWLAVLSSLFEARLLAPALLASLLYAGFQYCEMAVRRRIALSADATAMPAVFAVSLAGAEAAYYSGIDSALILGFMLNVLKAWVLGHAVMFALVFLADKLGLGPK